MRKGAATTKLPPYIIIVLVLVLLVLVLVVVVVVAVVPHKLRIYWPRYILSLHLETKNSLTKKIKRLDEKEKKTNPIIMWHILQTSFIKQFYVM